jgi:hypothetical protein
MRKLAILTATAIGAAVITTTPILAGGDLSAQDPISVRVDLGKDGVEDHKFYPDKLQFETGKLYKLVLHNPSTRKQYSTPLGLASTV